ncbi:MAG TPA: GYD domain-containing protein [Thermoplasmata archaeon]|nr:GYD domain-containing protein [Thermoplasmata archaeon]
MPTFIMLGRLTAQAKTNMPEALKQRDQLWSEWAKKGVKVTPYVTMGPFDIVNVIDAPSEDVAMGFLMAAGSTGNIDSTTMRAFTNSEMEKIRRG